MFWLWRKLRGQTPCRLSGKMDLGELIFWGAVIVLAITVSYSLIPTYQSIEDERQADKERIRQLEDFYAKKFTHWETAKEPNVKFCPTVSCTMIIAQANTNNHYCLADGDQFKCSAAETSNNTNVATGDLNDDGYIDAVFSGQPANRLHQ